MIITALYYSCQRNKNLGFPDEIQVEITNLEDYKDKPNFERTLRAVSEAVTRHNRQILNESTEDAGYPYSTVQTPVCKEHFFTAEHFSRKWKIDDVHTGWCWADISEV